MKLYRVTVAVEVEAKDEDDAYRVAENEVGGCFIYCESCCDITPQAYPEETFVSCAMRECEP